MTDAINSNPSYIISALQKLNISPLPVTQIICSTFSFSTMNPQLGVYWAKRWELYKQRYAVVVTRCEGNGVLECARLEFEYLHQSDYLDRNVYAQ